MKAGNRLQSKESKKLDPGLRRDDEPKKGSGLLPFFPLSVSIENTAGFRLSPEG